jgi:hypothetical protein
MQLRVQKPGEQKCLLYCTAMLLDVDVSILENILETDGQEKWWPDFSLPKCYRGIHIQEIQDIFIAQGLCLYPIEKFPILGPTNDTRLARLIKDIEWCELRFYTRILGSKGILIYKSHAKVLDSDGKIYDPKGKISELDPKESFLIREAWLLAEIKS